MAAQTGLTFTAPISDFEPVLTPEACAFIAGLAHAFAPRVRELLQAREARQARIDAGELPDFLAETREIRESDWTVAPLPQDLQCRRVEITGPVDRKMVINALNSGADLFMADFEDAHSPTWLATLQGQVNLIDAIEGDIEYTSPEGKRYRLNDQPATLMVRPRGWHLVEKHCLVDGEPCPAGLFDFGLYCFHNARRLLDKRSGPYFYLPKLEGHLEARLWNDVFNHAQDALGLPRGTIKATVLIETILAAFEMNEILYELRDHIVGLNCGRWDYIFSYIKKFRNHGDKVLPDRAQVTMTSHFMRSYSQLVIQTCHRRGALAMGGMAAQIPVKGNPIANEAALLKVRDDKLREVHDGHDGTWVAHPALVPIAMEVFRENMPGRNQLHRLREDVNVGAADLLQPHAGTITEAGVRNNIDVAIQYMAAWLCGQGAVPIHNLMEDAATAEISRAQIWQWLRHEQGVLSDGRRLTPALFEQWLAEELARLREEVGAERFVAGRYELAAQLFRDITLSDQFAEFLTLVAYEHLE
ncbi:MAG: malate synthase A [Thiotrichales bacterium]